MALGGLDNVAVQWPRTGRFYEPVAPGSFADFPALVEQAPLHAGPAVALATHIARTGTVPATAYTELVDLLLGMDGVLLATGERAEDEDPVMSPDDCAWLAGGLEQFVAGHAEQGDVVTFASVEAVLRAQRSGARMADQELRYIESRLVAITDEKREPPQWNFSLLELDVLAHFYRRCAEHSFAVYADFGAS